MRLRPRSFQLRPSGPRASADRR